MDDDFYDLSGRNPDDVDAERYDAARSEGFYPDEISLGMVYPEPEPPIEEDDKEQEE